MSFLLPVFVFVMALFAMLALDYDARQPRRLYGDPYGAAWVSGDNVLSPPHPLNGRVVAYRLP